MGTQGSEYKDWTISWVGKSVVTKRVMGSAGVGRRGSEVSVVPQDLVPESRSLAGETAPVRECLSR